MTYFLLFLLLCLQPFVFAEDKGLPDQHLVVVDTESSTQDLRSSSISSPTTAEPKTSPAPEPFSPTVLLENTSDAYAFVDKKLKEFKKEGVEIEAIDLYQVGEQPPEAYDALLQKFKAYGIKVDIIPVSKNEFDGMVDDETREIEKQTSVMAEYIRYELKPDEPLPSYPLPRISFFQKIKDQIKSHFGIANGVSFAYYRKKRPTSERLVEGGIAIGKAVFSGWIMHNMFVHENMNVALGVPGATELAVWKPIITASGFSLFFDYFQRGNSDFKGQGNRKFFLLTSFIHSLIMRQSIMVMAHMPASGFNLTASHMWSALSTTLRGVVGRTAVDMAIQRTQSQETKEREKVEGKGWRTITYLALWGVVLGTVQYYDMFNHSTQAREILTYLGLFGLGKEVLDERQYLKNKFTNFWNWVSGKKQKVRCETFAFWSPKKT